ncbi:hypothetical protein BHU72_09665 [Desulfuribacillus stibiiarsenatis]|uniref:UPF0756 membrane protein BHU72_09665 n=1 Tax=Desulfuribacillus stibiiarsenatis TaxID=1390249 RepID=A0A1E5L302_9FIRM|nr:DUF441 domain-containing protein [Desulfuribacillus stibiiarsenatis]OEH84464.1 hypothetical protein BHU72_09665 [Desulfuribacillus stibiiarsenatis]
MSQASIFLILLLGLGLLSKNQSVVVAVAVLLLIRWTTLSPYIFPWLKSHGLNVGIIIITIAVLIPIATGEVELRQLSDTLQSPQGWIVIISGLLVAMLGGAGVDLLKNDPQLTGGLVIGTILGVIFLKGIPVGPLIGAGIAVIFMRIYAMFSG